MIGIALEPQGAGWIRIVNELSEIPLHHADAAAALVRVAQLGREILGSHACTVTRVDIKTGFLTTVACDSEDAGFALSMLGREVDLGAETAIDPGVIVPRQVVERYDLANNGQGVASVEIARRYNLHSLLCHPLLKKNGELIGFVNHFAATSEPFSPSTKQLLEMFARQTVTVIERIEWQQTYERSVAGLNALSKNLLVAREDFLKQVAQTACDLLNVPICVVWQRAEHEQKLTVVEASEGVDDEFRRIELDLDAPGIRQAVATRDVKYMADVRVPSAIYGHSHEAAARGWVSLLCVPMMFADRLIGMLDVYTTGARVFERWEKEFFGVFANYAALSMSTFYTRRRFDALNDLMRAMTEARSIDELLRLFLTGGLNLVGATRGWISRLDLRSGDLEITRDSGAPPHRRTLRWGEGITGRAVELGEPINVGDVTKTQWKNAYVEFWPDTRSELAIPIMVRNTEVREGTELRLGAKPIGVLNVESSRPDAFTPTSENLLWSLAQHAAIVIENLEADERLASLRETEKSMGELATFDETAHKVLKAVNSTLGYDFVNISLVKPEKGRIKTEFVVGIPEDRVEEFKRMADHALDSDDIQAHIVRQGIAEVPPTRVSPTAGFQFDEAIYEKFGHERLIRVFVPMRLPQGNRVIGTIEAGYNQTYRRFIYQRDVNMLQGFADYAALALEHRKLLSFNLYVAGVLKDSLVAVGADHGSLLMLNKDTMVPEVVERKSQMYTAGHVRSEVATRIAELAVDNRQPYRIADITQTPEFARFPGGAPTFKSMLAVPIVHGDRGIGTICAYGEAAGRFTAIDEKRLVDIARSVAPMIEQLGVDAFIGHTTHLTELELFHGVAEELGRLILDSDKLRERIIKAAQSVLEADLVVLYEYDQETHSVQTPPTVGGNIWQQDALVGPLVESRAPYLIVRKGQSHYTESPRRDDIMRGVYPSGRGGASFVEREGIASSAGILLKAGKDAVGVLFLNYRSPRAFSDHEKRIIGGFAADVALALQEARAVRNAVKKSHQSALQQNRYVMAHRLKGPLISMNRRLVDIRTVSHQPEVRHLAIQASELNRHVQHQIAELNTYARRQPAAGLQRVSRPELEALLTETLASNRTRDDTRASVIIDPTLPPLQVDREALEDDFIGFLHDSERHADGPAEVRVEGGRALPQDIERWNLTSGVTFVKLVYKDNGPGVPADLKEKIFEQSFSTATDGTGLGLAIARHNATRLGGTLKECGEFGKGVAFEMYLPAVEGSRRTMERRHD